METVFLMHRLPSWSRNPASRPVRRPKIHMTDTGLAASLLGADPNSLTAPTSPSAGPLLESFAVNEALRQLSASDAGLRMHHYRDHEGHEVDLVIERADGALVAAEVKATSSPPRRAAPPSGLAARPHRRGQPRRFSVQGYCCTPASST